MDTYEGKSDRDLLVEMHTTLKTIPPRLDDLEDTQRSHSSQISYWKGAIAIIGLLTLAFGGVLLAHIVSGR